MRLLYAIGLFVIVSGLQWTGFAADEAPAAPETPAAQPDEALEARENLLAIPKQLHERNFWSVRLDLVMLVPQADQTAIAIDDPNNDAVVQGGSVGLSYNRDNELRPAIQYNCTDGNTLFEINYLRLKQINDLDLAPKAAGRYWALLLPANAGSDFALSVNARAKLTYIELNLDMQHSIKRSADMNFYVNFGVRWIQIDHQFRGNYLNINGGGNTESVTIQSVVNAGGFAFGSGLQYKVFSGLNLNAHVGLSLLQGSLSGSLFDTFNGVPQFDIHRNQSSLIPGIESTLFLEYNPDLELPYAGFLLFRAGYEMKNFFQVIDTTTFVDDIQDGQGLSQRTSFGISGYVFSLQFVWPVN